MGREASVDGSAFRLPPGATETASLLVPARGTSLQLMQGVRVGGSRPGASWGAGVPSERTVCSTSGAGAIHHGSGSVSALPLRRLLSASDVECSAKQLQRQAGLFPYSLSGSLRVRDWHGEEAGADRVDSGSPGERASDDLSRHARPRGADPQVLGPGPSLPLILFDACDARAGAISSGQGQELARPPRRR